MITEIRFRALREFHYAVKLTFTGSLPLPLIGAMTTRGLLIAIEGIDGSGKQTQAKLLELTLKAEGIPVYSTGFPQYDSWFGSMVGKFLNGDFGPLESVDPHFTALLYAGDRFEAKSRLEAALNDGKVVLVDRYIGSNLAHQVARARPEKRAEFSLDRASGIHDLRHAARKSDPLYAHTAGAIAETCGAQVRTQLYQRKA